MEISKYKQFLEYQNNGFKEKALESLKEFISSFKNKEEKRSWTQEFLENIDLDWRVRGELFEEVIFPVLLEGFNKKDIKAMFWLAKLSQNVYKSKKLHKQIQFKSEYELIRECFKINPDNTEITSPLLDVQVKWFKHCQQIWPKGILYCKDRASYEDCRKIRNELELARNLDINDKYGEFFAQFEKKLTEYEKGFKS